MDALEQLKADPQLHLEVLANELLQLPFEVANRLSDDKLWWSRARRAYHLCLRIADLLEGMFDLTEEEELQFNERTNRRMNEVMNQIIIASNNPQRAKLERVRQAKAACKITLEGASHFVWDAPHRLKENYYKLHEAARRWHLAAQPLVIAPNREYTPLEWSDYDEKDPLYRV